MAKVSVIIAAYNQEKTIAECIESVLAQTLEDIEAVVVSDASTDATLEIAEKLQKLDPRVKIVEQKENQGMLRSRKNGFAASTGEYILYLDADDVLESDACETAYDTIVKSGTDVVQFDVEVTDDEPEKHKEQIEEMKRRVFPFIPHKVVTVNKDGLMGGVDPGKGRISLACCNKIYKRDVVARTQEILPDIYMGKAGEQLFSFVLLTLSRSYNYIDETLYCCHPNRAFGSEDLISRRQCEEYAKSYFAYTWLDEWTKKRGCGKECKKNLEILRESLLENIILNMVNFCPKEDRAYFMEKILELVPQEDFLAQLSVMMYADNSVDPAQTAVMFEDLPVFASKRKEIRTVGTYYFRAYNGGIENVLSRLTDIWVKSGYDVVLFTDEKPNEKDYPLNPKIRRVVIPSAEDKDFQSSYKRILQWREKIEEYHVDTIVYHAWIHPQLVSDELAIKSTGASFIVHTHNMFGLELDVYSYVNAYANAQLSRTYRLADQVVALTDVDKAWWDSCGLPCTKTVNPISMSLSVEPSALNGHNLLYAGRISHEKQVIDILKIVRLVRESVPDVRLTIVGEADDREYGKKIKKFIKENKMEDAVIMAGYQKNVLPYYQNSDVMLCASKFEGFCLMIAESKICGLPLVTYELPNLDFIRDQEGMFIVEQNDVIKAAECVTQLLKDDELRRKMGREARESAEKMFGLDLAAHWKAIFERTLEPKKKMKMLCERTPLETAVGLSIDYTARGICRRAAMGGGANAYELLHYKLQCNALDATIKEIRSSTSYRIGRAITALPGVFVNLFRRLFGKKKQEEQ